MKNFYYFFLSHFFVPSLFCHHINSYRRKIIVDIKIMVRKTAKHVARNKKKYWRKISTKDIEDQLEDVRVQEMTGYILRISIAD